MTDWYKQDQTDVLKQFSVDARSGLADAEAARRLEKYGLNELVGTETRNFWSILWDQLSELMVAVLIVAAAVSALMGDYKDAIAISVIVVLNTLLGFAQEYRAEKAMAALRKLAVPSVRVRREGGIKNLPANQLVPGDIVVLEAGNLVAADCRVLDSANLQTQESALTGESQPNRKVAHALQQAEVPLDDRSHTLSQLAHVMSIRSERDSLLRLGLFSNKPLLAAVESTIILQLALIYVPLLQGVFNMRALSPLDPGISMLLSFGVFAAVELEKFFRRTYQNRAAV